MRIVQTRAGDLLEDQYGMLLVQFHRGEKGIYVARMVLEFPSGGMIPRYQTGRARNKKPQL